MTALERDLLETLVLMLDREHQDNWDPFTHRDRCAVCDLIAVGCAAAGIPVPPHDA